MEEWWLPVWLVTGSVPRRPSLRIGFRVFRDTEMSWMMDTRNLPSCKEVGGQCIVSSTQCKKVEGAAPCPDQEICCKPIVGSVKSINKHQSKDPSDKKSKDDERKANEKRNKSSVKGKKQRKRKTNETRQPMKRTLKMTKGKSKVKKHTSDKGEDNKKKRQNKKKKVQDEQDGDDKAVEAAKGEKFAGECKKSPRCKGECIPEEEWCEGVKTDDCDGGYCKCCTKRGGKGGGGGGGKCSGKCKKGTCTHEGDCKTGKWKEGGGCSGDWCGCCKPKSKRCKTSKKCKAKGGSCKSECKKKEKVKKKLCKKGCLCCVKKTKKKCKTTPECKAKGGWCTKPKACDSGKYSKGCKGKKCVCCLEEKVEACPLVDKCKKEHGTCKEWCDPYKYERELKWLCDPWIPQPAAIHPYVHKPRSPARISTGPACKCCAPKCEKSPSCTLWGGTCVNGHKECPTQYGFMVVDGCKGYDCKCCKPGKTLNYLSTAPHHEDDTITEDEAL